MGNARLERDLEGSFRAVTKYQPRIVKADFLKLRTTLTGDVLRNEKKTTARDHFTFTYYIHTHDALLVTCRI